jgi:hypothetical protein
MGTQVIPTACSARDVMGTQVIPTACSCVPQPPQLPTVLNAGFECGRRAPLGAANVLGLG